MHSPLISFTSSSFRAVPGEDANTQPGVFGHALATWLADELEVHGVVTRGVISEDFGWCIPVVTEPHRTYVACASADDSCTTWTVFVFSEGGLLARLVGRDSRSRDIDTTFSKVSSVLAKNPSVRGLNVTPA